MKPLGFVAVLHRTGVEETVLPCFLQAAQSHRKQGQAGFLLQHCLGSHQPGKDGQHRAPALVACVLHKEKRQRVKISSSDQG